LVEKLKAKRHQNYMDEEQQLAQNEDTNQELDKDEIKESV
jgi:hypothetical protein